MDIKQRHKKYETVFTAVSTKGGEALKTLFATTRTKVSITVERSYAEEFKKDMEAHGLVVK